MCSCRSIWDKWVWLLSSLDLGTGRVWEVTGVGHAGSAITLAKGHRAHCSTGTWELAHSEAWLCSPCQCLSHLGDTACCCTARPGCSLGQAGELMGFSFPCCDQTSLSFPEAPLQGVTQPCSQRHFQANSSFFSTLIAAEAVGQ